MLFTLLIFTIIPDSIIKSKGWYFLEKAYLLQQDL